GARPAGRTPMIVALRGRRQRGEFRGCVAAVAGGEAGLSCRGRVTAIRAGGAAVGKAGSCLRGGGRLGAGCGCPAGLLPGGYLAAARSETRPAIARAVSWKCSRRPR